MELYGHGCNTWWNIECDKDQKLNQSVYVIKEMGHRDRTEILLTLPKDLR